MNPFQRHGIDHLSASSLNTYSENPSFWCLRYLYNYREEGNPAMWRGSAVEAGLDLWLFKRSLDDANKAALNHFDQNGVMVDPNTGEINKEMDKERNAILPMLLNAVNLLEEEDAPDARQLKFEYWFDGIEIPLIGYIDYVWPKKVCDLKTTHRMPSEISGNHSRQISLYSAVKERPGELLYVTSKKAEIKPITDVDRHVRLLGRYAHSIRALLSLSNDKHDAASVFAPDFDHYYFRRDEAKIAAQKIWAA